MLTTAQRKLLLAIARQSIEAVLDGRRHELDLAGFDPELTRPSGAFVSLHTRAGDLRGCIGSIHPVAPLCRAVSTNAVNAAFRDPRFVPLRREELADVHVEISVMSPIEPVTDVEDIMVGRDGLIVTNVGRASARPAAGRAEAPRTFEHGRAEARPTFEAGRAEARPTFRQCGLLLPQVATEYGWDRETFLSQTCRKAGLPSDAWRTEGVRIERFSAEVFGELRH